MKNKFWILITGTVVLAVLSALMIVLFQAQAKPTTPDEDLPLPGGQTARAAHATLQRWMTRWAGDATLLSASASLLKSGQGEGVWTFLIYSPRKRKLALVSVRNAEVVILREQPALYPQTPLPPPAWSIDSDEAINRWWQASGRSTWLGASAQSLHIRLGRGQADAPTWQITILDIKGELIELWEIHADTGERVTPVTQ
jgi:hypothetical protein